MITCMKCGHANEPTAYACQGCGRGLTQERALAEQGDPTEAGDSVTIADDDVGRSEDVEEIGDFTHTAAFRQLQKICIATTQDMLSRKAFNELLVELENYLESQQARFEEMPDLPVESYVEGRKLVAEGLSQLKTAVLEAHDFNLHPDPGVLAHALTVAVEAEELIGAGRQLLQQAREMGVETD